MAMKQNGLEAKRREKKKLIRVQEKSFYDLTYTNERLFRNKNTQSNFSRLRSLPPIFSIPFRLSGVLYICFSFENIFFPFIRKLRIATYICCAKAYGFVANTVPVFYVQLN